MACAGRGRWGPKRMARPARPATVARRAPPPRRARITASPRERRAWLSLAAAQPNPARPTPVTVEKAIITAAPWSAVPPAAASRTAATRAPHGQKRGDHAEQEGLTSRDQEQPRHETRLAWSAPPGERHGRRRIMPRYSTCGRGPRKPIGSTPQRRGQKPCRDDADPGRQRPHHASADGACRETQRAVRQHASELVARKAQRLRSTTGEGTQRPAHHGAMGQTGHASRSPDGHCLPHQPAWCKPGARRGEAVLSCRRRHASTGKRKLCAQTGLHALIARVV